MNERSFRLAAALLILLSSAAAAAPEREAPAAVHDAAGVPSLAAPAAGLAPLESAVTPSLSAPSLDAEAAGASAASAETIAVSQSLAAPSGAASASAGSALARSQAAEAESTGETKIDRVLLRVKAAVAGWSRRALSEDAAAGALGRGAAPLAKPARSLRSAVAGAVMAAGAFAASAPALADGAAPDKAAVADIQELMDAGQPGVKVYVVGRPRVKGSELNRIAADVKNEPYVVLIADPKSVEESVYKNKAGYTLSGMDALESAAAEAVLDKSGVGARRGSIVSVLIDRQNGSQIGLVPSQQVVEHEIETTIPSAVAEKLGTGDVEGAVRDVVARTDQMLSRQTAAWQKSAAEYEAPAAAAVGALEGAAKTYAAQHPDVTGDLAQPDLAALRARLAAAHAELEIDPLQARRDLYELKNQAEWTAAAVKRLPESAQRIAAARQKLGELRADSWAPTTPLDEAEKLLAQAPAQLEAGSSAGAKALETAERRLESAADDASGERVLVWALGIMAAFVLGFIGWVVTMIVSDARRGL